MTNFYYINNNVHITKEWYLRHLTELLNKFHCKGSDSDFNSDTQVRLISVLTNFVLQRVKCLRTLYLLLFLTRRIRKENHNEV